jgi:hypothetical protein
LHKKRGNDRLINCFGVQYYDDGDFSWMLLPVVSKRDLFINDNHWKHVLAQMRWVAQLIEKGIPFSNLIGCF